MERALAEPESKGIRVRVANARPEEVGKGVARISRRTFQVLGLQPGDIVEIIGKRHTAGLAVPPSRQRIGFDLGGSA
jgi:transitional endoplasmic reticulum ATPase